MSFTNKKTAAIILAGGVGTRMCSDVTKQRLELCGISILKRSVLAFAECELVDYIVVVTRAEEIDVTASELADVSKVYAVTIGGDNRAESAKCGLAVIPHNVDFIAIHDAARPLITAPAIARVIEAAFLNGAATAAAKVYDTIKTIDEFSNVSATIPRDTLMRAQTPQVFELALYRRALNAYTGPSSTITDDNMLVEAIGEKIVAVDVGDENIKITTPIDLALARLILEKRG